MRPLPTSSAAATAAVDWPSVSGADRLRSAAKALLESPVLDDASAAAHVLDSAPVRAVPATATLLLNQAAAWSRCFVEHYLGSDNQRAACEWADQMCADGMALAAAILDSRL